MPIAPRVALALLTAGLLPTLADRLIETFMSMLFAQRYYQLVTAPSSASTPPAPPPKEEAAIERRLAAIRSMVLDALDAVMGEE